MSSIATPCLRVVVHVMRAKTFQYHDDHSSYWYLLLHISVLPQRPVWVTCHCLALNFMRNQYNRHDYVITYEYLITCSATSICALGYFCHHAKTLHGKHYLYRLMLVGVMSNLVNMLSSTFHDLHPSYDADYCYRRPAFHATSKTSELNCCNLSDNSPSSSGCVIGGGRPYLFSHQSIVSFIKKQNEVSTAHVFQYVDYVDEVGCLNYPVELGFVHADMLLTDIIPHLSKNMIQKIASSHKISFSSWWHLPKDQLIKAFKGHNCINCTSYTSIFKVQISPSFKKRQSSANAFANLTEEDRVKRNQKKKKIRDQAKSHDKEKKKCSACDSTPKKKHKCAKSCVDAKDKQYVCDSQTQSATDELSAFPPPALTEELSETIIRNWCKATDPSVLEEAGCAVCGELVPVKQLSRLKAIKKLLNILAAPGVTRVERKSSAQSIVEFKGPVLDYQCDKICDNCRRSIRDGKVPRLALANNLWIGQVPKELSELNFVEKLVVARIRHNCCFIKVASSGLKKMVAHVIAFESPIPKAYNILPPPVDEMDDVLAILFTGPSKPTQEDLTRVPLLISQKRVAKALEWLKLNHIDYSDLEISYENLKKYPEDSPPVSVEYRHDFSNKVPEGTSVFDNEIADGVITGDCPFIVHGLTGVDLDTKTIDEQKAIAIRHWTNKGKALAIGHSAHAESIYQNPDLYPQLFPWLFPYGHGGIGSTSLSDKEHKKHLLMYHDKRFQKDASFPFVAFSHEQIKASTTGGFLLAETKKFEDIAKRLLDLDQEVLSTLADKIAKGDVFKPSTPQENKCFQVIRDLDHINAKVSGSVTSKKYMRNEIWSLIAHEGAPLWYITLSPADVKNPIALYYADQNITFKPRIRVPENRYRLIANNPVACARFFHFMVEQFILHVLGVNSCHQGHYGETSAYYGTVEQQGRLTLHIHLMLWIKGGLTPDVIRDRIIDPTSDFQRLMVEYLENAYQGEFLTGTQAEVLANVLHASKSKTYQDPTETLPEPPPFPCTIKCDNCKKCLELKAWRERFAFDVDDVVSKSNIHTCSTNINKDGTQNRAKAYKGCLDNKWGRCKSRFPRELFEQTQVDPVTGSVNVKKKESWINNFSPVISYLFRCNTDVTSLRSGTAIKGTLLYVSDYITKMTLKTHVVFDSVRSVFLKNSELLGGSESQHAKARKLMTKMVNIMSAKLEMGSPMICMYLLGNPDHYTSHKFVTFYWLSFVNKVRRAWNEDLSQELPEKVTIFKQRGRIIGMSNVYDYIYRPVELENMSLYEWISNYKREKLPNRKSYSLDDDDEKVDQPCHDIENFQNVAEDEHNVDDFQDLAEDDCTSDELSTHKNDLSGVSKKKPNSILQFTPQHPLFQTHGLRRLPFPLVPNFVGQTLPRRDQGDREFYCTTMLTLFKPWRSGSTLKLSGASWDETFIAHTFTDQQKQIIQNFNIRYECLDQRDDFLSQLKNGSTIVPEWMTDVSVNEIIQYKVLDQLDEFADEDMQFSNIEIDDQQSRRFQQQEKSISVTKIIMSRLGWTACNPYSIQDKLTSYETVSGIFSGTEWKNAVSSKRHGILENRLQHFQCQSTGDTSMRGSSIFEGVKIVDKDYLEKKCFNSRWKNEMDSVIKDFHLNTEQERAFCIVANNSCRSSSEQLKMHIGGMGGTGKSQVLKALMDFFECKKESHRIVVVAPTGSAAALLGGSTYHYMFGINDFTGSNKAANVQLAEVKQRLRGVDYVFMDEVSMLSCKDLYRISERLAKVMNNSDLPFGGMNMIFAGDFAQLPPAIGQENASLYSRTVGLSPKSLHDQEAAIGKALWHQITTVVILRENMRQKTQTPDDARLREALSNMRYKACTPNDIAFLRSCISSDLEGRHSVKEKQFRNVSIITTLNLPKDVINNLGSQRFAAETGQDLIDFYSEDTVSSTDERVLSTSKKRSFSQFKNKQTHIPSLSMNLQQTLWDLLPCNNTKNIPGKLSLCRGLPVIIRLNSATELCITKGQEATVYDWQATQGSKGQLMLDTLFVKLVNPPQNVQLENLPLNIVPLTRTITNTQCVLPSDETINISRSQVEILPNFAMTDYTSQGKTRPFNVVDLSNARSHQSYYTALSRGASAAGTVILQGFDTHKITGGASGALRQEFREIEMLDDITTLRFNGKLPMSVVGECRNDLISSFRIVRGEQYIPSKVHQAIRWKKNDPFHLSNNTNVNWKIVDTSKSAHEKHSRTLKASNLIPAKDRIQITSNMYEDVELVKKRKYTSSSDNVDMFETMAKKRKTKNNQALDLQPMEHGACPRGSQWSNNSCAYDVVISILYNIWLDNSTLRSEQFRNINSQHLGQIATSFSQTQPQGTAYSLEDVRDFMRRRLQRIDPVSFAWGHFTSIQSILDHFLTANHPITSSAMHCPNNHPLNRDERLSTSCHISLLHHHATIQTFIDNQSIECASRCHACQSHLVRSHVFVCAPAILAFDMSQQTTLLLESLVLTTADGQQTTYKLRGVMYYSENHFTSRFITEMGSVWYHDGLSTGQLMVHEGNVNMTDFITCQSRIAICAVYAIPSTLCQSMQIT